jgi:tRNA A37 threonylcarbamoyladenosine dehydratase
MDFYIPKKENVQIMNKPININEQQNDDEQSNHDMSNHSRRFGGIERLYGETAFEKFCHAHICVVGVGGVGSWAAEALARSAIGEITLIDLDNVAESNVNRQIHAYTGEFGRAKVEAMAERINKINPQCRVNIIEEFVTRENVRKLMVKDFNYVIDCADNHRVKAAMVAHCRRNKIKIITVGSAGGQTEPTQIHVCDLINTDQDALLAKMRKLLRQQYGFTHTPKHRFNVPAVYSSEQLSYPSEEGEVSFQKPETARDLSCAGGIGSVMTVTASFGLVAVSHVLKKLKL